MAEIDTSNIKVQLPGDNQPVPVSKPNEKKTAEPITVDAKADETNAGKAKAVPQPITIEEPTLDDLQAQYDELGQIDDIVWDEAGDTFFYRSPTLGPIYPDWNADSQKDENGNPYKYSFEYQGKAYFTNNKNMIPYQASIMKYDPIKKSYYYNGKSDRNTVDLWIVEQEAKAKEEAVKKAREAQAKRRQIKVQMDAKKASDAKAAADKAAAQQANAAKAFPDMTFAEYNTDEVYDNSNSTAAELIQKAKAEGMTESEFLEAIQNTKWSKSSKVKPLLEQDKTGWADPAEKEIKSAVQSDPDVSEELANVIEKTPEELKAEEKAKRKAENKEKWNKFVKGDEEKYQEFLSKTNPNLVKAVFGNSGITLGDRLAGLGEILATLAADTANGIYAGVNKSSFSPVQGKMSKIYQTAAEKEAARKQERLDAANKSKIDTDEIMSYINNTSTLSKLPEEKLKKLASLTVGKELTKAEFIKQLDIAGEDSDLINNAYDDYKYVHKMWQTGTERYKGNLENVSTELDITSKQLANIAYQINTEQQLQDYINGLLRAKEEMKADLLKIKDASKEEYFKYIEKFLGYMSGTETMSTSAAEGNTSGWDFNANAKVGYGPIGATVGGGANGTKTANSSLGTNVDILKKYNIPVAEAEAANWVQDREQYVNGLRTALNEQIAEIDKAIAEAKARKEAMSKKIDAAVNDGIIKAPHMKQWILREDGTKIRLNPNDSIYATKKKLTSKKDDGKDIVPMEKEDKAIVIQRKLGYKDSPINKDFGYYLTKLK